MAKLQKDFTQGNITKALITFAVPFLAANLLQALYGVADVWFVSRFCGPESVSGVNIGSQITHLLTMAVSGLTVGGTILVTQFFAARKEKDVSEPYAQRRLCLTRWIISLQNLFVNYFFVFFQKKSLHGILTFVKFNDILNYVEQWRSFQGRLLLF